MATMNATHAPKSRRESLLADHARFELLFDRLVAALDAGSRADVECLWTDLETGLKRHMRFEERALFPALSAAYASEIAALRAEHARLRVLLGELGVGINLHEVGAATVAQLRAALRSHAQREEGLIYNLPEVERRRRDRFLDGMRRLIAAASGTSAKAQGNTPRSPADSSAGAQHAKRWRE